MAKSDVVKTVKLKGKRALLLAEACKLNKEKKDKEARIKEIKEELKLTKAGNYVNEAGDSLNIAINDKWKDIDPIKFLKELKKKKLGKTFPSHVKVQVKGAVTVLGEATINKLRKKDKPSVRWTFK